ncbi:MAG: glycoside hydrolase family 15 protein [Myxococcota bacterium]|jgi:GH15 family glucan-1,4-alpha-glucosidase|nr:glycoside hydrolase family 15 [Deltaproteobacteria bacterium]MCP4244183.1 glycoside hydrolase family 15 protein [bacterium]MDP6076186.1 glycoside hydrolase family 15 protein [Myxococcota bacterium]MDP6242285.1 glycoside hydrolase family 15 protein [Myxococcota bacterium]MDP7076181.1 glycoside hydrolase family 15 protein [Myxococcota bacterium]
MDIFTATKRISRSFLVGDQPLSSGSYGAIGDGHTCALVGIDGSVDWLCLPRFDSPSVFARLLDSDRGGCFRVSPAERPFESLQAYDDATNVLQTLFRRPGEGAAVVTDLMPWNGDPRSSLHQMLRLVEGREGVLEMEVLFDPRFDYGRSEAQIQIAEAGVLAKGGHDEQIALALSDGAEFETDPRSGVRARFSVHAGERVWVVLNWTAPRVEPVAAYRPFEHLRATRRFWRSWSSSLQYDGPWRHDVLRSALTLKLLQYAPTGAMVAAPTTSLPVQPGGDRNWDYRFSWVRDSAMAIRAMNQIGYPNEAVNFFHFVRDTLEERRQLDLMVTLDGQDVPDEILLTHLSGHRESRPVRIGNAARHQIQHDIVGPLLDAAAIHEQAGGTLGLRLWRQVRRLVTEATEKSRVPDHGIWEPRSEPDHHVHSKLMTWVALDRAIHIAPRFGGEADAKHWAQTRSRMMLEILERGYSHDTGTFVAAYGAHQVDATLLLLPKYGFLPPADARVQRTLQRVIDELSEGRFLRRYRGGDGIASDEGAFILCGFWLAEALALSRRLDEALEVFQNHLSAANHLGMLSEEVDPASGAPLGNTPQAFSHLGLIQAAARLDRALRLRDEKLDDPPYLEFDFPSLG